MGPLDAWFEVGLMPFADELPAMPLRRGGGAPYLRLTKPEVERAKLDLLVRVRLPVDVSLQPI